MTTMENSGSPKTDHVTTGWFRRATLGVAFAAVGMLTLGTATTPAQAYWYGHHPYYVYYHPYHYGWYHYYPAYYGGWGWHPGWGWQHGWHHW
jgi:hypothetical protein